MAIFKKQVAPGSPNIFIAGASRLLQLLITGNQYTGKSGGIVQQAPLNGSTSSVKWPIDPL